MMTVDRCDFQVPPAVWHHRRRRRRECPARGGLLEWQRLGEISCQGLRPLDRDLSNETGRPRLGGRTTGLNQVKLTENRPYADPEVAARKLLEIANSVEWSHLHRADQRTNAVRT
jgi:hypothetical protein